MNAFIRIAGFPLLLLAVGFGAYWFGHDRGLAEALPLKTEAGSAWREIGHLREALTRLAGQRIAPEPGPPVRDAARANAPVLERWHMLADFKKKNTDAYFMLPLTDDDTGKLAGGFIDLFNLTPEETAELQRAIDQARQQTDLLMAGNATVTRRPDGAVVISVAPASAGNPLRTGLLEAFAQTLGPERNEAFLALEQEQLGFKFGGFGAAPRTITFARFAAKEGNEPGIAIKEEQLGSDPEGAAQESRETTISGESSIISVLSQTENLRWVLPLVPPDF